jgi:Flp pilus assembly protein TadB
MNRSLLILFLLIFTSACTVQKRLHRPGWHVSWNKNYKQNKGSEELEEKSVSIELTEEEEFSSFEHESNSREEENLPEYELEHEHEQLKSTSRSEYADQLEIEITTDTLHTPYERDTYISKRPSKESKSKSQFGSNHTLSIVLFFLFLLSIVGISALLYNISIVTSIITAAFYLFGVLVLIVLGLLFLIGSIIALFYQSKSRPKNRANTESTESKEKEENKSPEKEQPEELETERKEQESTTKKQEKTSKKKDLIALSIFGIAAVLIFFLIYN